MTVYSANSHPGSKHKLNVSVGAMSTRYGSSPTAWEDMLQSDIASTKVLESVAVGHTLMDVTHAAVFDAASTNVEQAGMGSNDWLLLCSDGLNDELTDDEIATILRDIPDTGVAVARLIEAACEASGRDNVGTIIIQYDGESVPNDQNTSTQAVHQSHSQSTTDSSPMSGMKRNHIFEGGLIAPLIFFIFWVLN